MSRGFRRCFIVTAVFMLLGIALIGCSNKKPAESGGTPTEAESTPVPVVKRPGFGRGEIVISVFWPPMTGFTTDTQYEYLKEANIDMLEWGSDPIFTKPETVTQTLDLCNKYGIKVTICDETFGDITAKTDDELKEIARKYMQYECVAGFYLKDEPGNANPYGRVTRVINEVFPGAICQMNMLPMNALADASGHAQDWINAAGAENLRYLSFDQYPFGPASGSVPQMFPNMNFVRETGLKYGVDTALYIQSIGVVGGFRKPTVDETRYHTSAALAYGYKNLKYFTWITPVERNENFTNAIINPDGSKNEVFDGIVDINASIKRVSSILGNLDSAEIYHNGRNDMGTVMLPENWYVKATDKKDFLVAVMTDRDTNRNYLMFVNKNYSKNVDLSVDISGLLEKTSDLTDVTNGMDNTSKASIDGSTLTVSMAAGGFRLYMLDEGISITKELIYDKDINMALGKAVYASYSEGENGSYVYKAVDGICISYKDAPGWRLNVNKDETGWITVDLKRVTDINRVDIYPYGMLGEDDFGKYFPKDFTLQYSENNKDWNDICSFTDYTLGNEYPMFKFDTVKARYVRLFINAAPVYASKGKVVIAEIEIYNDDGSIPKPDIHIDDVSMYEGLENFALKASVKSSSSYEADGWNMVKLVDGDTETGWTSYPGRNATDAFAEEWCYIRMKRVNTFNTIVIYPRWGGAQYFPKKIQIQISDDGKTWTDLALFSEKTSVGSNPRVIKFDSVTTQFIRLVAKEMTTVESGRDGYMFQLAELQVYNS